MPINVVSREEWNAMPPKFFHVMTHPVEKVVFTIENHVPPCTTKEECLVGVKEIQNYYSDIGLEDMPYNFVVGNDGNVYEGRGWKHKPGPNILKEAKFRDQTIDVGIICGEKDSTPEVLERLLSAFRTARAFIDQGIEQNIVTKNYEYSGFSEDIIETTSLIDDTAL